MLLSAQTRGPAGGDCPAGARRLFGANIDQKVYKVMRAIFRISHGNLMRVNLESAEMRNYLMKTGGRY